MSKNSQDAAISIEGLNLDFPTYHGTVHALDNVSIEVRRGEIVGLVGESGSGKSVTAMSIVRLLPAGSQRVTGGRIAVLGRDMLGLTMGELQSVRGDDVAMVFQEPMNALNPTMRIGAQICQVILRHQDVTAARARDMAAELLQDMRISDPARIMRNYPFELSGGMRQRVLLAMAFSCQPDVLIADEPTTALDVTVQAQVLGLMQRKARETGSSVLFITHDMAVVSQLCDRVYVMYAGQVVETGRAADVLGDAQHPYTQALLRSLPELAEPRQPLATIPGTVPGLINPPEGCRFRDRCLFAHDRCAQTPRMMEAAKNADQAARCWLLDPDDDARGRDAERRAEAATPTGEGAPPPSWQTDKTLLEVEGLEMRFSVGTDWRGRARASVHALNGVDLALKKGETLGIVGESGCGKSTLAQAVMGMLAPSGGRIVFDGNDITALSAREVRALRRRYQIVFQDPQSSLNPRMPVWRAISEPLLVAEGLGRRALRARAGELAERVGLKSEHLDRYPHEFSGGQRQRIAIARALALQPDLLVLDEPTSALDVSVQAQTLNLLLRLQQEFGLTYLLITHDVSVVRHMADRVAVMYLGQVVEQGPVAEVLGAPRHPYSRTLLDAVPKLSDGRMSDTPSDHGELPSNMRLPTGCFFRDRCAFAADGCEEAQSLSESHNRLVRCHRADMLPDWHGA